MNQKFYICKHCGNVIEKVEDKESLWYVVAKL